MYGIDTSGPYNLVFSFNVDPLFFLCNVGNICAMLARHLEQSIIIKNLTSSKQKLQKNDAAQTTMDWPVQYHRECLCAILSEASKTTLHRVFPVQHCPRNIKTTQHRFFFPAQCCLEPHGQHCTRFLPLQKWPMANRQLL